MWVTNKPCSNDNFLITNKFSQSVVNTIISFIAAILNNESSIRKSKDISFSLRRLRNGSDIWCHFFRGNAIIPKNQRCNRSCHYAHFIIVICVINVNIFTFIAKCSKQITLRISLRYKFKSLCFNFLTISFKNSRVSIFNMHHVAIISTINHGIFPIISRKIIYPCKFSLYCFNRGNTETLILCKIICPEAKRQISNIGCRNRDVVHIGNSINDKRYRPYNLSPLACLTYGITAPQKLYSHIPGRTIINVKLNVII